MLCRSFRSVISCLSGRKNILNAYCSTSVSDISRAHPEETKYINTVEMKEIEQKESKVVKKRNKNLLDVINHVQSINPDLINICPNQLKFCKLYTDELHLINKDTAAKYVSLIISDLLKNTSFVAELNPGFGLLTTELLKAGVPLIHLYEARKELHPILNAIHDIYPGKLDLRSANFFKLSSMSGKDKIDGKNRVQEIFQGVKSKDWEDETCIQVVGAIYNTKFFSYIVYSLLYHDCFMFYGRPVFYIAIPPSLWNRYTCNVNDKRIYTSFKVIFQTTFDYKFLGVLDRKAFLPWPMRQKKFIHRSTQLMAEQDYEQIYVIKVEPKTNIYSQLSQQEWITFLYFTRYHMQKRSNRVIPELEKWIPGCGIRLIAKDYTIFTEFGDLTPIQILELFKEFKSWPEYKESYFLASMKDSVTTDNKLGFLAFHSKMDE